MTLTKDKFASLLVFCAMVTSSLTVLQSLGIPPANIFVGLVGAAAGLSLIWFAEPLGEIACFARGIPVHSPPLMIEAFGWLFLVGYPVLLVCLTR
jgi:hypothetical protein